MTASYEIYVAVKDFNTRSWHLGSTDRGRKTACGRLLREDHASDTNLDHVECLTCLRSHKWPLAIKQERVHRLKAENPEFTGELP